MTKSRRLSAGAVTLLISSGMALAARVGVLASAPRVALGSAEMPAGASTVGPANPAFPMRVQLVMSMRDAPGLEAFVAHPGHSRLDGAAIRSRFGPAPTAMDSAVAYLSQQGFRNVTMAATGGLVDADGTVGMVESAFHSQEWYFRELSSGSTFVANRRPATLPAGLAAGISAVNGLSTRAVARRPHTGLGPSGGYTPAQLKSVYALHTGALASTDGTGQTIGVLEFDVFQPLHVAQYDTQYYGNPQGTTVVVAVDGGPGAQGCCGGQVEVELDIEVIHAIAPKSTIRVYEAPNSAVGEADAFNQMVTDGLTIATTSWGQCEQLTGSSSMNADHQVFLAGAAQGMAVYAAAGDNGAYDCRNPSDPNDATNNPLYGTVAVDHPASDPLVTAVGGTNLRVGNDNFTYASESAWGARGEGGGGGRSVYYSAPPWQAGDGVTGPGRQVPDLAFDGDPASGISIYTYTSDTDPTSQGWTTVGGTSAGSPAMASANALINQAAPSLGATLKGPAQVYFAAQCHPGHSPFHDVTSGNNLFYQASSGFDLATGWGSPAGADLASTIYAQAAYVPTISSVNPNSGPVGGGTQVTINGCGFRRNGSVPPAIKFGGNNAAAVAWVSSTQLAATTPANSTGSVDVSVINPDSSTATLPGSFSYAVPPPPPPGPPPPAGGTDLYGALIQGGASGTVEVHGLAQSSHYTAFNLHTGTAFGTDNPADWVFQVAPLSADGQPDLFGIHLRGTGSGRVEVHVLSASSGYRTFVLHAATPLGAVANPADFQFAIGSVGGDRRSNLFAIAINGTGSGRVEVHALSENSGYSSWVVHAATPLGAVAADQWRFLVGDARGRGDLVGIAHASTGSGGTEVHVLSRDSGYGAFSVHAAVPLPYTSDSQFQYMLGDHDADGIPDLYAVVMNGTGSGRSEVHVLSGSSAYVGWVEHAVSGLDATSSAWQFSTH